MSGWLKALPLALALAVLSVLTLSCKSINVAQIRVVNAIPDGEPLDVYINGAIIATNLQVNAVAPDTNPASYISVTSGMETLQSFPRGGTTNPIPPTGTLTLNGSTKYTVVAVGLELNDAPPLVLTDNNTVPTSGKLEFRIVNASPSSPAGGVDVYFVPPQTDITDFTPQISALGNGQASNYQKLDFLEAGYSVIVTKNGGKTPLLSPSYNPQSGSITTLVLVDNVGGNNGMSQTPLVLQDLD